MSHVIEAQFFRAQRRRVAFSLEAPAKPPAPVERPASVAQALALAHHVARAIESGRIRGPAALARALGFTRPRITQLLQLAQLAPDLQARVIFLMAVDGREPVSERALRFVAAASAWGEQRERFAALAHRLAIKTS